MSQTESFEDFLERNGLSRFQNDLKKNGVFSSSELLCEIKSKNSKLIENLKPSTTEKLRMERAISFLQKVPIDKNGSTAVEASGVSCGRMLTLAGTPTRELTRRS